MRQRWTPDETLPYLRSKEEAEGTPAAGVAYKTAAAVPMRAACHHPG
jgi:hypothetical protein